MQEQRFAPIATKPPPTPFGVFTADAFALTIRAIYPTLIGRTPEPLRGAEVIFPIAKMTDCDGSCFRNHDPADELRCQDGEVLTFFYCHHYYSWILATIAPPKEEALDVL
jgi:hypothetical protein